MNVHNNGDKYDNFVDDLKITELEFALQLYSMEDEDYDDDPFYDV